MIQILQGVQVHTAWLDIMFLNESAQVQYMEQSWGYIILYILHCFFRKNRIVLDNFSNLISLDANPKWRHV